MTTKVGTCMPRTRVAHLRHLIERSLCGYVYVVELQNGTVKVGRTGNPERRINEHNRNALAQQGAVARSWASSAHRNSPATEQQLIDFCRRTFGEPVVGREVFANADFDRTVRYASRLPLHLVTDESINVELGQRILAEHRWSRPIDEVLDELAAEAERAVRTEGGAAASEALYQWARFLAEKTPAPWTATHPFGVRRWLMERSGRSIPVPAASEFERSMQALFVMSLGRFPETFDEFIAFLEEGYSKRKALL